MGDKLAHLLLRELTTTTDTVDSEVGGSESMDIDVVIPIPETSRTAALQCAQILNRPYREVIYAV